MRRLALVCLFAAFCPARLFGGPILGTIYFRGQVLRRAAVHIACPGGGGNGSTLDDGSYRINVQVQGSCTLTVNSPAGAVGAPVVSSAGAAQYNFAVVQKPDGGWELRRQ
jgi:hypothetical protein